VTVDEEFNKLDDDLRRLKIEYEVYFNGAAPRPPHDTLYRVENMIKRYSSEQSKLNFSQRFRFTSLAQKYAVNSNLWRRRLQEREEGRSLTGPQKRAVEEPVVNATVRVVCSDPDVETDKVSQLLEAMKKAKLRTGESVSGLDPAAFHKFIKAKTRQIKEKLGCDKVQFSVSIEQGKVKFKAAKAE
jgi:transposase-like protein